MNALFEAAKRGDVVALKRALKDPNIDPNFQDTKTGMTALHTADETPIAQPVFM